MKEFALLFRTDFAPEKPQPTKEKMKEYMEEWMEWIDFIGEEGQLSDTGNQFSNEGKVLSPGDKESDGPFLGTNQAVAGYIIVLAKNMDDAVTLARKCPILKGENTSIEIRELQMTGIRLMAGTE